MKKIHLLTLVKQVCKEQNKDPEEYILILKRYYSEIRKQMDSLENSTIFLDGIGTIQMNIGSCKRFFKVEKYTDEEKEKVNRIYARLYSAMGKRLEKLYKGKVKSPEADLDRVQAANL